ncbi:MAG: alpha/beta fold hydrolase [Pseudomonadota bacterium]|nr:alpha/beta fold hydrolase [Pseudomonadota bacterium]
MTDPLKGEASALAPKLVAPQHRPRPLTLFLELVREETAGDPQRLAHVLTGLRKYQEAQREAPLPPKPSIAQRRGAALRDYGGDGPPVIFIPSLINPPNVLDLSEERSLLRWLAAQGLHVLLLDWGWDVAARRSLSVAGHVEEIAVPFIDSLDEPPAVVGHCLGGTMAVAAAALAQVRSLATIAAPWRFSAFPEGARTNLIHLWRRSEPAAERLGALPMEVLQSAFWRLDPVRTVSKFERLAGLPPGSDEMRAFVALEDWANDGPPLPVAAAREMFEIFFGNDAPGRSAWRAGGIPVHPAELPCPVLNIASVSDRIVPHASAPAHGERIDLELGHVGMVVGSRARALLWEPLLDWLSRARSS